MKSKHKPHWPLFVGVIALGFIAAIAYLWFLNSRLCKPERTAQVEVLLKEQHASKKSQSGKADQTAATKKDGGSTYSIAAVKVPDADGEQTSAEKKGEQAYWKPSEWMTKFLCQTTITDVAIALFTYCLFIVAWFQAYYMRRQLVATEQAAIAASRQARIAVATELPVVAFVGQKLIGYDEQGNAVPELDPIPPGPLPNCMMRPLFCIRNAGKGYAAILRFSIRWKVAPELPPGPPEPIYGHMAVGNLLIEQGDSTWLVYEKEPISLSDAERSAINSNQTHLWVYGFIAYGDILEDMHTIGFCYRWEIRPDIGDKPRGLIPDGPPRYRYQNHHQKGEDGEQ